MIASRTVRYAKSTSQQESLLPLALIASVVATTPAAVEDESPATNDQAKEETVESSSSAEPTEAQVVDFQRNIMSNMRRRLVDAVLSRKIMMGMRDSWGTVHDNLVDSVSTEENEKLQKALKVFSERSRTAEDEDYRVFHSARETTLTPEIIAALEKVDDVDINGLWAGDSTDENQADLVKAFQVAAEELKPKFAEGFTRLYEAKKAQIQEATSGLSAEEQIQAVSHAAAFSEARLQCRAIMDREESMINIWSMFVRPRKEEEDDMLAWNPDDGLSDSSVSSCDPPSDAATADVAAATENTSETETKTPVAA
eukprot:Gregarina_sp_Poly_1__47@NODE_100_length_14458_cov_232_622472_g87_i0_p7_GENE_NODE_100_length_14458_cov_232_622472_g87_i0NODE_100_length_14458_cov_232_622472_g87_i0_p7_ORF_typecomplete_len312_score66_32PEPCK_ATP/PF01293_20/0_0083DUF5039/PF16442_5/0_37DUF5039/PF16442_5/5_7e02FdhE/PF04216_12/5_9FdhE/PF04216_12/78_NODE_100_length_14458_cov_232_622472_g87_i085879522